MPIFWILGGLGVLGYFVSDANVERTKRNAVQEGKDNMNKMRTKVSKVPTGKYCKEAQDIFTEINKG